MANLTVDINMKILEGLRVRAVDVSVKLTHKLRASERSLESTRKALSDIEQAYNTNDVTKLENLLQHSFDY